MAYWLPHVPNYVWSIVFLIIILALNLFSVKGYGKDKILYNVNITNNNGLYVYR